MKTIFKIPAGGMIALLLVACSAETHDVQAYKRAGALHLKTAMGNSAANPANVFDNSGSDYRAFLLDYQQGEHSPETFDQVRITVGTIMGKRAVSIDTSTRDLLSLLQQYPEATLDTLMANSGLSQTGQALLKDFVSRYEQLRKQPFAAAYSQVVSWEAEVMGSEDLDSYEAQVALTVSAIGRYSLFHECCDDTDWESSVGNIAAAAAGALQSSDRAIQYTLLTRIAEHYMVSF